MNRVAYCYLTDFRNDPEMFAWSEASLRHHCGDVDVFVCTAGKRDGAVDISGVFRAVYGGDVDPLAKCAGNPAFPLLVFGKFVVGLCPEFAAYDRVVVMDGDVEVVDQRFAGLGQLAFPGDADVGLPPRDDMRRAGLAAVKDAAFRRLWSGAGALYTSAGLVVCRPGGTDRYRRALRTMLAAAQAARLPYPEELSSALYLSRWILPAQYHFVPSVEDVRNAKELEAAKRRNAFALHYGGPRKRLVADRWRARALRYCEGEGAS